MARVAACGISTGTMKVEDNAIFQGDVIRIRGVENPTEEQMRCVAEAALESSYFVFFDEPLQQRFWKLYFDVQAETGLSAARQWLADRNLLDKLPPYAADGDLSDYGRRLEAFCGLEPGAYLEASPYGRILTPKPPADWSVPPPSWPDEALTCVTSVTRVSGVDFGLIGNAAYESPGVP